MTGPIQSSSDPTTWPISSSFSKPCSLTFNLPPHLRSFDLPQFPVFLLADPSPLSPPSFVFSLHRLPIYPRRRSSLGSHRYQSLSSQSNSQAPLPPDPRTAAVIATNDSRLCPRLLLVGSSSLNFASFSTVNAAFQLPARRRQPISAVDRNQFFSRALLAHRLPLPLFSAVHRHHFDRLLSFLHRRPPSSTIWAKTAGSVAASKFAVVGRPRLRRGFSS